MTTLLATSAVASSSRRSQRTRAAVDYTEEGEESMGVERKEADSGEDEQAEDEDKDAEVVLSETPILPLAATSSDPSSTPSPASTAASSTSAPVPPTKTKSDAKSVVAGIHSFFSPRLKPITAPSTSEVAKSAASSSPSDEKSPTVSPATSATKKSKKITTTATRTSTRNKKKSTLAMELKDDDDEEESLEMTPTKKRKSRAKSPTTTKKSTPTKKARAKSPMSPAAVATTGTSSNSPIILSSSSPIIVSATLGSVDLTTQINAEPLSPKKVHPFFSNKPAVPAPKVRKPTTPPQQPPPLPPAPVKLLPPPPPLPPPPIITPSDVNAYLARPAVVEFLSDVSARFAAKFGPSSSSSVNVDLHRLLSRRLACYRGDHPFLARTDSLWTEQYRPTISDEMITSGGRGQHAQVRDWLRSWSQQQRGDTDSSMKVLSNTLLLVGPPSGKTSLIYACCHESGNGVIEISNSDRRSKADVLAKCEEATQSHRLALIHGGTTVEEALSRLPTNKLAVATAASSSKKTQDKKRKEQPNKKSAGKPISNFFSSSKKKSQSDSDDDFLDGASAKQQLAASSSSVPAAPLSKSELRRKLFANKNKSIQVAVKGMPESIDEMNEGEQEEKEEAEEEEGKEERKPTSGQKRKKSEDLNNGQDEDVVDMSKKMKTNTGEAAPSSSSLQLKQQVIPLSSQSSIVFEEIDHVFEAFDPRFLHAVRTLISNAKRPILLTCNIITPEIQSILLAPQQQQNTNQMASVETICFHELKPHDILPFIYLICMIECGFHSLETQRNIPSLEEIEQLLKYYHCDMRKTMMNLQARVNSLPLHKMLLGNGSENQDETMAISKKSHNAIRSNRYPSATSSHQDLILASIGLLGKKEEIMSTFAVQKLTSEEKDEETTSTNLESSSIDGAPANESSYLSLTTAFSHARSLDVPLVHLNYLTTYMHLLTSSHLSSSHAEMMSDDDVPTKADNNNNSWFNLLPLRQSVLPLTAAELFPLHDIQLTSEQLAIMPTIDPVLAMSPPTSIATPSLIDRNPLKGVPFTLPLLPLPHQPLVDRTNNPPMDLMAPLASDDSPSVSPALDAPTATAVSPISGASVVDLAAATTPESDDDMADVSARKSRKKKFISMSDDPTEDDAAGQDAMGEVDVTENDETGENLGENLGEKIEAALGGNDADLEMNDEAEVEVEITGVVKQTKAQRRAMEAQRRALEVAQREAARRLVQTTHTLRDQQRRSTQELLIQQEEEKRARELQHKRALGVSRSPVHSRCLEVLDGMASMAENISAMNIYTQPSDSSHLRLYPHSRCRTTRSYSRYHPAIHDEITTASRDFFPIYLESFISSSHWYTLEQQHQDLIETEVDQPVIKEKVADSSKVEKLTSLRESDRKRLERMKDELEYEDYIRMSSETSKEMAAVMEVHAMFMMQTKTRELQERVPSKDQIEKVTNSLPPHPIRAIPFSIPPPVTTPLTAAVPSTADNPIVIDSQESDASASPPPPPTSNLPLFLPSIDPISLSTLNRIEVYRSPATTTLEYRKSQSELALEIWYQLNDQQHAFISTAFMCDIFPFVRSFVFDALDHSPHLTSNTTAVAASSVDSDAVLAVSLATGDAGRSSRRTTRAARLNVPQLSRRWQHLSNALSKSIELLQQLQQSAWKDVQVRPLQTSSVWQTSTTVL